jgi:hypothetical protein
MIAAIEVPISRIRMPKPPVVPSQKNSFWVGSQPAIA